MLDLYTKDCRIISIFLFRDTTHDRDVAEIQTSKKNKKQETKRFSTFAVFRLRHSETKKKHCLIRESSF